ncbi:hypothetical protein RESH_03098 [Rhodopirellula europaea SH398]|uniref:Uncharacterized protein n=1 Tax=Rhodopirellula europaea SH398 TaxID=1263868 RepID=M5SF45_9BACT|nr:hypothetical protein RESH_03098 [Rhodopirellula europaea SH398]
MNRLSEVASAKSIAAKIGRSQVIQASMQMFALDRDLVWQGLLR